MYIYTYIYILAKFFLNLYTRGRGWVTLNLCRLATAGGFGAGVILVLIAQLLWRELYDRKK